MIENLLVHCRMFAIRHTHWRYLIKSANSPLVTQEKILEAILRDNRNTRYGNAYRFDEISSYQQFAQKVPVVAYETLRPHIEMQMRSGIRALTTAQPTLYATTSGTTGEPKYVPIIQAELQRQKRHTALLTYCQYQFDSLAFSGKVWVMAASAVEGRFDNGISWGSASGFLYASMSPAIAKKYLIPPEVFAVADNGLKYDLILRLALAEKNITYFSAANPTTLLRLCELANLQGCTLAEDIEHGRCSRASELAPDVMRAIRKKLRANPGRAAELRSIFNSGRAATFGDLWPSLRLVSTWTSGNCGVAVKSARKLIPTATQIVELGYLSSEFCGTLTVDCNVSAGLPTITDYFYEFIEPEKWDSGNREFRLVHQLESGQDYYVVITTPSGLYRYFINDIVRVEGFFHKTPLIRFVQKGKGVTNITGEKLYESQITETLVRAERRFGVHPDFYLVLAYVERQTYHLYLEANVIAENVVEIATYFDTTLAELNTEYRAKRESVRLKPLEITLLKQGTGELYRAYCIQSGQKDGQFKVVTLQYADHCQFPFHLHAKGD
ncbi:MAG: GH3 auxin-responsive promoter family protein [Gallionellaceae bacterium]|nr:GH3 auxin-responsive promoter family protein [Gallionellaceae bacterium]